MGRWDRLSMTSCLLCRARLPAGGLYKQYMHMPSVPASQLDVLISLLPHAVLQLRCRNPVQHHQQHAVPAVQQQQLPPAHPSSSPGMGLLLRCAALPMPPPKPMLPMLPPKKDSNRSKGLVKSPWPAGSSSSQPRQHPLPASHLPRCQPIATRPLAW